LIKNKSLKTNIASLGFLQIVNFVVTLITLPYLARVLGVSTWGAIVFVQLVINYLIWFTNWGFYFGATRRVAANRENSQQLNLIFVEVWGAQWILSILMALLLWFGVLLFEKEINNPNLYLIASGLIVGNLMMPLWFLNGIEYIKEAAIIQLAVKLIALPFIFLLVNSPSDANIYLWINSLSAIFVGVLTILWMNQVIKLSFFWPDIARVVETVKADFELFVNSLWANLNTSIIPAALGMFAGDAALGYYNIAERARSAAITVLHPISHALFPRMCYLFSSDHLAAKKMLKNSAWLLLSLAFIMSVLMYSFSEKIVMLLGGDGYYDSIQVLEILAFSTFLTTVSAFIVNQILIPSDMYKGYTVSVLMSLIFSAIAVIPMIDILGVNGAAFVTLSAELLAVIVLLFFLKRHKLFSD
jgi:PST family polysaccharide transporter